MCSLHLPCWGQIEGRRGKPEPSGEASALTQMRDAIQVMVAWTTLQWIGVIVEWSHSSGGICRLRDYLFGGIILCLPSSVCVWPCILPLGDTAGQHAIATHPLISQRAVALLSHCGSSRREELGEHSHCGCRQGLLLHPMLGFKTDPSRPRYRPWRCGWMAVSNPPGSWDFASGLITWVILLYGRSLPIPADQGNQCSLHSSVIKINICPEKPDHVTLRWWPNSWVTGIPGNAALPTDISAPEFLPKHKPDAQLITLIFCHAGIFGLAVSSAVLQPLNRASVEPWRGGVAVTCSSQPPISPNSFPSPFIPQTTSPCRIESVSVL